MNYTRSSSKKRDDDEVNITPVMNLFLVLIPFLLLTAEFVRIAVLELNLPATGAAKDPGKKDNKPLVLIMVRIDENGIKIKGPNVNSMIARTANSYEFEKLKKEIKQIKAKYPDTDEVMVQSTDNVTYENIVHVMDACRDNGFPNVSISGG